MEFPPVTPPLPTDYYRRQALRIRQLAKDATTPAVKEHLQGIAREYERLAERVEATTPSAQL